MASPHVAGVAAAQWGEFPDASAIEVIGRIYELATEGAVIDPKGPNYLLFADYQCSGDGKSPSSLLYIYIYIYQGYHKNEYKYS